MLRQLILILLLACICTNQAVAAAKQELNEQPFQFYSSHVYTDEDINTADSVFAGNSQLPRHFGVFRRQSKTKAAPTTTERPLIRVWNSIVRNVRPSFGFRNLTNPLANFFNEGSANIIETPPVLDYQTLGIREPVIEQDQGQATSSGKRKRKPQKKNSAQKRRRTQPDYGNDERYNDGLGVTPPQEQPMFFYDANSGSYYGVQRFSAQDYHNLHNYYGADADNQQEIYSQEPGNSYSPSLGKINTKKLSLLHALPAGKPLKFTKPTEPTAYDDYDSETFDNRNEMSFGNSEENTAIANDHEDDNTAEIEQSGLSESVRNTLGTYMRDDQHSRQRQRTPSRNVADPKVAKATLRQRPSYIWLRAW